MPSSKRVREIGRWRLAYRWGHYRIGFRRSSGRVTGALPFLWFTATRRNKRRGREEAA